MKILKQFFSVLFVLLCVVGTGYAATFDGVRELVSRRAPWLGKHIQFKEIASSDGDCFILQTVGKKLVVQSKCGGSRCQLVSEILLPPQYVSSR